MSISRNVQKLVFIASLVLAIGCSQTSAPEVPSADAGGSSPGNTSTPFDEGKGYLHKPSGVGFVYPEGWENLGVKSQGSETSLGLRKGRGDVEATLSWSEADSVVDEWTIGLTEYEALRALYKDNVRRPEPIMRGPRHGYRLAIVGGPLGVNDPESLGVVYLFVARRGQQAWTIKLRATARGQQNLALVDELLGQYRW
jgi:hypothetical protein